MHCMVMVKATEQLESGALPTTGQLDEMTRNQLSEEVQQTVPGAGPPDYVSYGLGWGVSLDGSAFHPGTGMTDIRLDPTRRVATGDWEHWKGEVVWMTLYFSVGVWVSLSLIHAPAPELRAARQVETDKGYFSGARGNAAAFKPVRNVLW